MKKISCTKPFIEVDLNIELFQAYRCNSCRVERMPKNFVPALKPKHVEIAPSPFLLHQKPCESVGIGIFYQNHYYSEGEEPNKPADHLICKKTKPKPKIRYSKTQIQTVKIADSSSSTQNLTYINVPDAEFALMNCFQLVQEEEKSEKILPGIAVQVANFDCSDSVPSVFPRKSSILMMIEQKRKDSGLDLIYK